ncbi:ribosomal-protein-alanine N-acetyltransferase [Ruminococcaceae bacterium YRB3002]|nr:ribosomal-protein-alanine N-acetyltransferase [Ruminococcaceae bacterium YRB3002]
MERYIRFAREEDLEFILRLEQQSPAEAWSPDSVAGLLGYDGGDDEYVRFAVVMPGYGYMGISRAGDEAEVLNLIVDEKCRRQKAGYRLMMWTEDLLRLNGVERMFLEVEEDNIGAIALYRLLGYEEYNRRYSYYGPGRDAVLMKKELGE